MATHVLLQAPNDGYYFVVKAAIEKHFSLVDRGFIEICSGSYEEMEDFKNACEIDCEVIELFCPDTNCLIQTTDDCLRRTLELYPDYLDNKEFI